MSNTTLTATAPASSEQTSTVTCPECRRPATVVSRFSVAGTPDKVEYLRIRCDGPLSMLVAVHELRAA